jgi:hypothetical protein
MSKGGRPRRKPYDATGGLVEKFGQSEANVAGFVAMVLEADLWSSTAPAIEPGSEEARRYAEHLCELGAMVATCIESRDATMLSRLAKAIDQTPKGEAPAVPEMADTYKNPETVPQRVRRIVEGWTAKTPELLPIAKLVEMVKQSYGPRAEPKELGKLVREAVKKGDMKAVKLRQRGRPGVNK